jgi:hypothetical protein
LDDVFLVAHFLGEDVGRVESTGDVNWLHLFQLNRLMDAALADVELMHVARDSLRVDPSERALVVAVEERGSLGKVGDIQIFEQVPKTHHHFVAYLTERGGGSSWLVCM